MNERKIILIILLNILTLLSGGCIEKPSETYTNSIGMEFVLIPAGEFMMETDEADAEEVKHEVIIEEAYYLGKYEVTQEQWQAVMESHTSWFNDNDKPVECVDWYDVQDFVMKLNEMEKTNKYRLPSEAEWEYACRAGTTTRYFFGNNESNLDKYAWYKDNSEAKTHPVGQKTPNPWGLYDMYGNVLEWCQDTCYPNYELSFGCGMSIGEISKWEDFSRSFKAQRGGSWNHDAESCQSTTCSCTYQEQKSTYCGFRLLMEVSPTNLDDLPNTILKEANTSINNDKIPDINLTTKSISDSTNNNSRTVVNINEISKHYTNSIDMDFMLIPAGEFMMGSNDSGDLPVHEVTIKNSYYLGKYEVTQAQWKAVMESNPSMFEGDKLPVEQVSWYDVQVFIEKLNEMEKTNKYRLPSEAEWEYACRAGTTTLYSFGDNASELNEYAWYNSNSDDITHLVGLKNPNYWGLYDMHGNVWEWCQDEEHDSYIGAPIDGNAWEDKRYLPRVTRGGSWFGYANNCFSTGRFFVWPECSGSQVGFRLLMETPSSTVNFESTKRPTESGT